MLPVILVIDDDKHIRELLRFYLNKEGYHVVEAEDGSEASAIIMQQTVTLAIIDVMLPHKDGFAICREIRDLLDIPILMLTAKGETEDKVKGFLSGTDDYMVKPFEVEELLFRVKALLRRYKVVSAKVLTIHEVVINQNTYEVHIGEEILVLPLKEFQLLSTLASYPNQLFTRDQLLDAVWGADFEGDARTIDVHIKRLREKFYPRTDAFSITTIRGLGYKLEVKV
ncbi:response regulator transcription factor [Aneurinibacillus sp. REN35]|uniref:response regulator transcription factor n=1 Tax=Aneurinibacillus sp. REN35 TaxID=3237286 RepID=UPI00352805CF